MAAPAAQAPLPPPDKICLTLKAVDNLYLPGPSSSLLRASKGHSKTYSIKPSTAFRFLFNSFCSSLGLDVKALDFVFVTDVEPLCPKNCPQDHIMINGDVILVMMKKKYYIVPPLPPSCLPQELKLLVNDPTHADVVFSVEGEKFYAHKAILCTRCEKFSSMFQSRMREFFQQEIVLQIERPEILGALLEYIYTDNVENLSSELAVDLMACADEYLLPRLRKLCEIQVECDVNIDNACTMICFARDNNAPHLERFCLDFILQNFRAVSATPGFEDLKNEPELLMKISRALPEHLAQPLDLVSALAPKQEEDSAMLIVWIGISVICIAGLALGGR